MTALDFPSNPTQGDVFGRWQWDGVKWISVGGSGGGGGGVDPAAQPLQQSVIGQNPVTLPTPYAGTNPRRSYMPIGSLAGSGLFELAGDGYQVRMLVSGTFFITFGWWSQGTIIPFARLRSNGAVVMEGPGPREVVAYLAAGDLIGLEFDGDPGNQADDPAFHLIDLRRTV